ncbi:MAG: glycosyltransferase [Chloroflexi bacterium]|nr:glycosyltransferase [Chloroflexota bacterium]
MDFFIAFVTFFLVLIALTAILNALTFPRLSARPVSSTLPLVSVLIPARDESTVIAGTIKSWLLQTYPHYEVILLDDDSSDDTATIARDAVGNDTRVCILDGRPLPEGWKGKNWACYQLAHAARGEILIFTDADVRWKAGALASLVAEMTHTRADLLSVFPTQITRTWAERLVVPLMGFVIIGYLPVMAVHYIPWPVFSAAIGQCLAFRREAYEAIGGHGAVRDALVEDMVFAWKIKRKKMRLRLADGAGLVSTRMYRNWREVRNGFAKSVLGGHAGSLPLLLLSTLFHWSLFLFPWFWLFFDPMQALILGALNVLIRALTAAVTRQRVIDALFLPISVLLMTVVAARAVQWHFTGGPRWKGRAYGKFRKQSRIAP